MKISICLLLLAIIILIYASGTRILLITSNSMRPALIRGDVIVACKGTYVKGSIITFHHNRSLVTHRLVNILPMRTKGDFNMLSDEHILHAKDVVGKACLVFPTGKLFELIHDSIIHFARLGVKQ